MLSLAIMLFPFVMPWYDTSPTFINLSSYLHTPAGAYGFISEKQGHLFAGNDRIRFVGMNFSQSANLPATKRDAEIIAGRLAKYGINCVRLSALDYRPAPDGIFQSDMKTLDPAAMGKLDYFIYQLKENGIYVLMQLHVARNYPGLVNEPGTPVNHSGIDNFFGEAIQQQKEFATTFLNHLNPYTGTKYADEPAVAMIEINNENALSLTWWDGSLDKAPAVYQEDLKSKWNTWLRAAYKDDAALMRAWPNEPLGVDFLANADFANHINAWQLQLSRGAMATSERLQDTVTRKFGAGIRVERLGQRDHDVQFSHEPLNISQDSSYTLKFRAKSDDPRTLVVALVQPEPYRVLYRSPVSLTADWKDFSLVFTPDGASQNARLTFSGLAAKTGAVQIFKVSLQQGGALGAQNGYLLGSIPIIKRSKFSRLTRQSQIDWIRFLADTEDSYWTEMYRYLKNDLNVKSLIIGTQQSYSPYQVQKKMDVIDIHGYWDWQKPVDAERYRMSNKPQVGDRNAGVIGAVATRRVAAKPFIVSEYNYRGANTYATEADLLMLAYASFQDWDGVFIFNYANNDRFGVDRLIGDEGFNGHSNRFAALVPAAVMFYRGDIKPSLKPFTLAVTRDVLENKMRVAGPAPAMHELGLDVKQPLKTGIGLTIVDRPQDATVNFPAPVSDNGLPIVSDTGELTWNPGTGEGTGVFTINTLRTRAVVGYVKNRIFNLGGVQIAPGPTSQDWAAITLTSMSGSDSVLAGRVLLTATGSSVNAGMVFDDTRTIYNWGKGPVLVEGVPATIILPVKSENVRAWALDEVGNLKSALKVVDNGDGRTRIDIDERYRTVWYMLEYK